MKETGTDGYDGKKDVLGESDSMPAAKKARITEPDPPEGSLEELQRMARRMEAADTGKNGQESSSSSSSSSDDSEGDGDAVMGEETNANARASAGTASASGSQEVKEDSKAKRQRVCAIHQNQGNFKEDISKKAQNKILDNLNKVDIIEVYSPPRVSRTAEKYGIICGGSFDITRMDPDDNMPWD